MGGSEVAKEAWHRPHCVLAELQQRRRGRLHMDEYHFAQMLALSILITSKKKFHLILLHNFIINGPI